jgi:hypothetical protein
VFVDPTDAPDLDLIGSDVLAVRRPQTHLFVTFRLSEENPC